MRTTLPASLSNWSGAELSHTAPVQFGAFRPSRESSAPPKTAPRAIKTRMQARSIEPILRIDFAAEVIDALFTHGSI